MQSYEERINAFKKLINEKNKIIFFGGAGTSTESGIPDFRSKDGLYNQHDVRFEEYRPEYLLSSDCLYHKPKVFYEFYKQKMDVSGFKPNDCHYILSKMESDGKLLGIITQNIDGLHQKAGSKRVYEIHGTTARCNCTKCDEEFDGKIIFEQENLIPRCPECGGMLRPLVTLYGENLPNDFYNAQDMTYESDMLIVGGTSLTVYPAAGIVRDYPYYAKPIVIINNQETPFDKYAKIIFRESISQVLKDALNINI